MPIYKMQGKKDGRQKYRVRINFNNAKGEDKQMDRAAYGYDEARQLEDKLTEKLRASPPSSGITIKDLYDEYINFKRHHVKTSSLEKSEQILSYHILPEMGAIRADKFGLNEAQAWKDATAKKTNSDEHLSLTMKRNIYKKFSYMLN